MKGRSAVKTKVIQRNPHVRSIIAVSSLALALTFASAAHAEDPYIQSLGSSGISTGYRMKGGISRVEVDFQLTTTEDSGQTWIFGTDDYENTMRTMCYFTGTGVGSGMSFRVRGGDNIGTSVNDPDLANKTGDRGWNHAADTDRHLLVVDLKNGRDVIVTGTTTNMNSTFSPSLLTGLIADLPLSLFAKYGNRYATSFNKFCHAKIYGVKIYENYDMSSTDNSAKLVHNFVPCLKDGETPCFKDLVGGGFIIGENVEAFAASDNAPTYQDDGYASTVSGEGSKMYIDTGCKVYDTTTVELDCAIVTNMIESVGWYLFDCNNTARFQFGFGQPALRYYAGGSSGVTFDSTAFPKPADDREVRRTFILDNYRTCATVVTSGFTNRTVTFTRNTNSGNSGNLIIGAYYSGGSLNAPIKIYGCKIYESGELVHDFVPFVKYDYATGTATPGLLDSMAGAFVPGMDASNGGNLLAYGGTIAGEQDAYIESNGSTGMNSGYKMKGNESRVEVDYSLTDIYANSTRIFGDNSSNEKSVKTMFYFTGSAGETGGAYTFRINANNTAHDCQWSGTSAIAMDKVRRTLVADLKAAKCQVITDGSVSSKNCGNASTFVGDFEGRTADLPLSLFANYNNAAGTTYAHSSKARIYSVRFYENYVEGGNNTPVRELIPYSRGGVVGFYDTVTGEIVKNDNAAAGAFTFGGVGSDHGNLNCYLKPGYVTKITHSESQTKTLTAYAPGATSYKWFRDGQLIDDNDDGVADGADGVLSVKWARGGTKTNDGYLHTYQAVAVFNLYGVERESESAEASVTSSYLGTMLLLR